LALSYFNIIEGLGFITSFLTVYTKHVKKKKEGLHKCTLKEITTKISKVWKSSVRDIGANAWNSTLYLLQAVERLLHRGAPVLL
jgi:hypothetical protein